MTSPDTTQAADTHVVGIGVLGLNHESAPLDVREAMACAESSWHDVMTRVKTAAGLAECVLLSTCNRTEIYFASASPVEALPLIRAELDGFCNTDVMRQDEHTYYHENNDAVRHLLRVASGLDSLIVGESQILTQVKRAYDVARQAQHAGSVLNRLFQTASHTGKRARTETEIDQGAVSVASAGVSLVQNVFGNLGRYTVFIVGAGETARLAAEHLRHHGAKRFVIANRTESRAQELAETLNGRCVSLNARTEAVAQTDILVTATNSPAILFNCDEIRDAMRTRPRRPLLILDLSVPRNVDPAAAHLDEVFHYDMDALSGVVEHNLNRRRTEIPRVEAIVSEEAAEFTAWYDSLAVVPLIKALRESIEEIRIEQIRRYGHQFTEEDREQLDLFTRALVRKILHNPITRIRSYGNDPRQGADRLDAVRDLFGLGDTQQ